jgi:hypothetical protein
LFSFFTSFLILQQRPEMEGEGSKASMEQQGPRKTACIGSRESQLALVQVRFLSGGRGRE